MLFFEAGREGRTPCCLLVANGMRSPPMRATAAWMQNPPREASAAVAGVIPYRPPSMCWKRLSLHPRPKRVIGRAISVSITGITVNREATPRGREKDRALHQYVRQWKINAGKAMPTAQTINPGRRVSPEKIAPR
jgi:hypothetical protein